MIFYTKTLVTEKQFNFEISLFVRIDHQRFIVCFLAPSMATSHGCDASGVAPADTDVLMLT